MRRLLIALGAVLLLAVTGCGSSGSGSGGGVRGTELSYFPAKTPFVLSIQTDPNSSAVKDGQALLGRFPTASLGEAALMARLQQLGINYSADVRPLFGNPALLGDVQATLNRAAGSSFLGVWVTKDASKLAALIKKAGLHGAGNHDGATIYQAGASTTFAIDGATLVAASSQSQVFAALDRHAHGAGLSSGDASRYLAGLPQNALFSAFGSLSGSLSGARTMNARRVPWVGALRGYGVTISPTPAGLTFQYRLDTSGSSLSAAQLPIAAGSSAPSFAGGLPITFALNNPAQVVTFAEGAAQAANPAQYAVFLKRQATLRAKTGVDVTSLAKLLTGTLIIASDTHATLGRTGLSDPTAAAADLAKLATQPKGVFSKTTSVATLGGGFYALKEPKQTITVGIVGNELVVGRAPASTLRAFASAPATPASGAQGSLAFRIALNQLLAVALKQAPPKALQSTLAGLGDISGWTAASSSGLTGSATLALK